MRIVDSILLEIDMEAARTRKLLERVPGDKLTWKPHKKSMSLGQLALHVASIPGNVASIVPLEQVDPPDFSNCPAAETADELVPALEDSVANAKKILDGLDDQTLMATWRMVKDGKPIMEVPRIGVIRTVLLNHWYHHRGQLTVYLRLLDVPLPATYGASADENPFA